MKARQLILIGFALATAACGQRAVEVDHPFYLMFIEDPRQVALFRCPGQPGVGCAIDGLPGPYVEAAGANERFIVVAQRAGADRVGPTRYYYFAAGPGGDGRMGQQPRADRRPSRRAAIRSGEGAPGAAGIHRPAVAPAIHLSWTFSESPPA